MVAPVRSELSPVVLEVIEGSIRSAEIEIEAAVERTARSPMIRDQHDYRVALFDARGRKLTGRSYSAVVEPVFERWAVDEIRPGDVFFWNDPYNSTGGIGHVPDLCTTVPIFHGERLIAFAQVFGHHDDVGGMVPGSLPVHATSLHQEGLIVPPIKLYDAGQRNDAAFEIICRNSRLPDHLRGDIDAEIGACLVGARRVLELCDRYGADTVEAGFDALIAACARTIREELLPKIADGVYTWEDYVEHDGVEAPRLHAIRLTMTKTPEKLVLDFTGTDPQARGPINWAANYGEYRFAKKWIAPILRNLADTPERAAEIDVNEGSATSSTSCFLRRERSSPRPFRHRSGCGSSRSCAFSASSPAASRRRPAAACRPTRRRSGSGASTAGTTRAASSSSARCSAAAPAGGGTRTARTSSTSFRTRATCRRSSRRPATRSWSSSSRSSRTRAGPASGAAASATTRRSARSEASTCCRTPTARC